MTISSIRGMLTPGLVYDLTRAAFVIVLVWFGSMNFMPVGEATVTRWIGGHAFLGGFSGSANTLAHTLGAFQIVAALLIAAPARLSKFNQWGFLIAADFAALALTLMFTNPVWIDSLGGFPAIGSGQGIIKYLAIFGLALWASAYGGRSILSQNTETVTVWSRHLMVAGLILVLAWIGAMKFTLPEAQGIDPLLRSSPFFSWLPPFVPVQTSSNVIGAIELITAALLAGWWFNRRLFLLGVAFSAATFILTLSFLVTFPGWASDLGGFPALSGSGHFLLKDLLLLTCCAVLATKTE